MKRSRARFFIAGDKLIAANAKVASTSIAMAVLGKYYPKIHAHVIAIGKEATAQAFVPVTEDPEGREVLLLFRDPYVRGRATRDEFGHFRTAQLFPFHTIPQSDMITDNTRIFLYPEHLPEFQAAAGIQMQIHNPSKVQRPIDLEVRMWVEKHWKKDIETYNELKGIHHAVI